jgi:hypothetical protein
MDIWVDTESLVIRASGPIDGVCFFEGQEKCIKIVSDVSPAEATAVRDPETGAVTLQADPLKVQAKLDQAWTALRTERNRRLAATDWFALSDAHLSQEKKDAWFAYRQELRDLPDEVTLTSPQDLDAVAWPLDPTQVPVPPVTGSRLDGILGQV